MQASRIPRWAPAAGLAVIIAAGAALGFALSRPPAPAPAPTPLPPAPRSSFGYSLVDDPVRREVVLFGGVDNYGSTWLWDGRRWTQAHPASSPPGRFGAPAAYDPVTHLVMVYGGRLADGDVVDDTWGWDGRTWHELDSGTGGTPPGEGGTMVWDPTRGEMVLALPIVTAGVLGGQTWVWTGARWTRRDSGAFPAGVEPVAAAFDTVTSSIVAVGAQTNYAAPASLLTFVTLRWDGTSWTLRPTAHVLESVAGIARDPLSGRLLVAQANAERRGERTSTAWTWTGADWRPLTNTNGPPWADGEVTDSARNRLVLLGTLFLASQSMPQRLHAWAWEGGAWRRLDPGG